MSATIHPPPLTTNYKYTHAPCTTQAANGQQPPVMRPRAVEINLGSVDGDDRQEMGLAEVGIDYDEEDDVVSGSVVNVDEKAPSLLSEHYEHVCETQCTTLNVWQLRVPASGE